MPAQMTVEQSIQMLDNFAREQFDATKKVTLELHQFCDGQFYPQGDLALQFLASLPKGLKPVADPSSQLAIGTTQGSRHIWSSMAGIKVYCDPADPADTDPTRGDYYVLDRATTLTHPEHGDHTYPAGFIGRCIYQRQFAEELKRMAD